MKWVRAVVGSGGRGEGHVKDEQEGGEVRDLSEEERTRMKKDKDLQGGHALGEGGGKGGGEGTRVMELSPPQPTPSEKYSMS